MLKSSIRFSQHASEQKTRLVSRTGRLKSVPKCLVVIGFGQVILNYSDVVTANIFLNFQTNSIEAIWMLPTDESYGTWPRSGEIDIVEARGNADLTCTGEGKIGNTRMYSTLHWGPDGGSNQFQKTSWAKFLATL